MNTTIKPNLVIATSSIFSALLILLLTLKNEPSNMIAFSDLMYSPNTLKLFVFAILIKSAGDFVWLKIIKVERLTFYIFPLAFAMLSLVKPDTHLFLHWTMAVIYFLIVIFFQYTNLNRFRISKLFIILEIIAAIYGFLSEGNYLFSEAAIFLLISIWQYFFSLKTQYPPKSF